MKFEYSPQAELDLYKVQDEVFEASCDKETTDEDGIYIDRILQKKSDYMKVLGFK